MRVISLVLAAGLLAPASVLAAQPAKVTQESDTVKVIFDEIARKTIRDYFGDEDAREDDDDDRDRRSGVRRIPGKGQGQGQGRNTNQGLPPGLAKRDDLPPGLQKQLERNGNLPPGLAGRALPSGLERRLPPLPAGVERASVADDVVLIEKATGRILDIVKDVMGPRN